MSFWGGIFHWPLTWPWQLDFLLALVLSVYLLVLFRVHRLSHSSSITPYLPVDISDDGSAISGSGGSVDIHGVTFLPRGPVMHELPEWAMPYGGMNKRAAEEINAILMSKDF